MGFVPGLVVAFCGVLLSAALPPSTLWPLTLALVPLFVMVAGSKRPRQAFWLGVVFGATFFSLYILWLPSSFSELLGSFFWVLFPPLVAVLAGFWGLVCWSSRAIGGRGAGTLWLLPAFWVLMEWARTQGYLGFPWGTLGYAWLDTPVAQLADSIGTYGLSLLSTVLVALVAAALSPYTDASPERSGKLTRTLGLLLVATALGVGSWIVGLSKLDRPVAEATRTALLVQGNGDPFGRAVSAVAELDVYTQLTREGTGHLSPPPSYVIWPEGAVLGNTLDGRAGEATRQIVQKSAAGLTLIVGSRAFEAGKSFNSAYSLSGGQVFDRYDKRFLVPFGERWPLIETAAPLYRAVFGLLGLPLLISTSPGKALEPLLTPEGPVAAYICYESVFPQVQRLMVRRGSELLINITNDAWFARGNGARQHFDMGRMRAIETRRYLLRAGNDGITAVVDPRGESRLELERRVQGSLLVSYGLDAELTPYVRYGHLLVYVLITYLVLAGAAMRVMGNE